MNTVCNQCTKCMYNAILHQLVSRYEDAPDVCQLCAAYNSLPNVRQQKKNVALQV